MLAILSFLNKHNMLSLQEKNQRYQQTLNTTHSTKNNVYALEPTLIDPAIPFEHHLKLHAAVGSLFPTAILKLRQPAITLSASEDMNIIQFKKDSDYERWFAIKSPRTEPKSEEAFCRYLALYENNLRMHLNLKEHALFIPIHALCIKQPATSKNKTPFLIFPYYNGSLLSLENNNNRIDIEDKIQILKRIKHALLHLHDCGIYPHALSLQDVMLSNDNEIKLINYDHWYEEQDQAKLTRELYTMASRIALELANDFNFDLPNVNVQNLTSRTQLNQSIDTLIHAFEEAEFSYSNTRWC